MLAFEIYVNGQKRFIAGGDYQILNAVLTLIHIPMPKPYDVSIFFSATGINPAEMATVGSWPTADLKVGDRVVFSKYGYDEVKVGGAEYFIVAEANILAIINE